MTFFLAIQKPVKSLFPVGTIELGRWRPDLALRNTQVGASLPQNPAPVYTIRATMYFGAPFNEFPRLPFQIGNFVSLGARFLARLPKMLGEVRRGIEKLSPT